MCQQGPRLLIVQENPETQNCLRTSRHSCADTMNRTQHCRPNNMSADQCDSRAPNVRTQVGVSGLRDMCPRQAPAGFHTSPFPLLTGPCQSLTQHGTAIRHHVYCLKTKNHRKTPPLHPLGFSTLCHGLAGLFWHQTGTRE